MLSESTTCYALVVTFAAGDFLWFDYMRTGAGFVASNILSDANGWSSITFTKIG